MRGTVLGGRGRVPSQRKLPTMKKDPFLGFSRSAISAGWLLLALACPFSAAAVTTADQVCAPADDPCVVNSVVVVDTGAVLDFGLRTLQVTGGGTLDFGGSSGQVFCGRLELDVGNNRVDLRGAGGFGGSVVFLVKRACSGAASTPCLNNFDCALVGAGSCTIGDGNAILNGKVRGTVANPGSFSITAAAGVSVGDTIDMDGANSDSDGGDITISALAGPLILGAGLQATGGGLGGGGVVSLLGGQDITVSAEIDVTGGDFDGGLIEIDAVGNVNLNAPLSANAAGGEGFGGEILVTAAGNIDISGGSQANRMIFSTDGNGANDTGGDGGEQVYEAGGTLHVSPYVKLRSNGALPDGFGGNFWLDANGSINIEGTVESLAKGSQGGGGIVDITSLSGDILLASDSMVDLTGGSATGGDLFITASDLLVLDGDVDTSASNGGVAGSVSAVSGSDLLVSGSLLTSGASLGGLFGAISLEGCEVQLLSTAVIDNQGNLGKNTLTGHGSVSTLAGSLVSADPSGENRARYRLAGVPPSLAGSHSPVIVTELVPSLLPCGNCGDGVTDSGELCDDGNLVDGDGCSATCIDEGCIAATPGYPTVSLCDDGVGCTVDSCDTQAHVCVHVIDCDDGIACTVGSCVADTCANLPDANLCGDGNDCTVDSCSALTGCDNPPEADGTSCGASLDFCSPSGQCSSGSCEALSPTLTGRSQVKVSLKAGVDTDKLLIKADLALADFTVLPSDTGLTSQLGDNNGLDIWIASIPSSAFENKRDVKFKFKDKTGANGGITKASVSIIPKRGIARVKLKAGGRSGGVDLNAAAGQALITASLLFGADVESGECLTTPTVVCKGTARAVKCKSN